MSLILNHDDESSTDMKIENLKEIFQDGTILESIESEVIFPTFHVKFIEESDQNINKKVHLKNIIIFELTSTFFFSLSFIL